MSLDSLPRDVLLRLIAPLLADDELIKTARCSHLLMSSLQQAQLRLPHTLRELVQYRRNEMKEFIQTINAGNLLKMNGWKIDGSEETTTTLAASVEGKAEAEVEAEVEADAASIRMSSLAIGLVTSLRVQLTRCWKYDHEFMLPHLNRLPRSIRAFHFCTDGNDAYWPDMTRICLPAHLTALKLQNGICLPRVVIESLTHLDKIDAPMYNLLRRPWLPASPNISAPETRPPLSLPASLRTLIIESWCASGAPLSSFKMPPELTHLSISQCNADILLAVLTQLPHTLKFLYIANNNNHNNMANMSSCVTAIDKNLFPPSLESLSLAMAIESTQWHRLPLTWHNATIRTLKFEREGGWIGEPWQLNLPVDPLTRISHLTSLTLPTRAASHDQLCELTSLTHLAQFDVEPGGSITDVFFPPSLEHLEFSESWKSPLIEWNPPPRLHTLSMGDCWNLPLTSSLRLPAALMHLRFGLSFERPPRSYSWPPNLKSVTLASGQRTYWPEFAAGLSVLNKCRLFVPSHLNSWNHPLPGRLTEYREDHEFVRLTPSKKVEQAEPAKVHYQIDQVD